MIHSEVEARYGGTPLNPNTLGQRQAGLCEFQGTLVYIASPYAHKYV